MISLTENTISQDNIIHLAQWLLGNPTLTQGDRVKEFEAAFAKKMGRNHAVFVNSGSSANLLMLYTLKHMLGEHELKDPNYKIVIPTLSWATDLAPAIQLGLEPILVDCNMDDLSVDLDHLEDVFNEHRPQALMMVSILGLVPDMNRVAYLCSKYEVHLLEDTCESLGSQYRGQYLGSFGLMSSFSFYFSHHISTIEGGMILTNDEAAYNLLVMLRSHGWGRDLAPDIRRNLKEIAKVDDLKEKFTFYVPGFNFRSTDLQAFIGLEQLEELDHIVSERHRNYKEYSKQLSDILWTPIYREGDTVSNFGMPIISKYKDRIVSALNENEIECRPLVCGSLGLQPMWKRYNGQPTHFTNADEINRHGIYIPNHSQITFDDVDEICSVIKESLRNG